MKQLIGTEKQVKWAEDIRNKWLEHLENQNFKRIYSIANEGTIFENIEKTDDEVKEMIVDYINNLEKAADVIDLNRKDIADLLIIALVQEEKDIMEELTKDIEEFRNLKEIEFIKAYDIVDIYFENNEKPAILENLESERIVQILQR